MTSTRVKCPTCARELEWNASPFRPFCSERCRLIDLGAWLSERRAIATEDIAVADDGASDGQRGRDPGERR